MALTRVRSSAGLRLIPWDTAGKHHLLELQHDSILDDFLNCYNEFGVFDESRIPSRNNLTSPPSFSTGISKLNRAKPIPVTSISKQVLSRGELEDNNLMSLPASVLEKELARKETQSIIYNSILAEIFECDLADAKVSSIMIKYWNNNIRTYQATVLEIRNIFKGIEIDGISLYSFIKSELQGKKYYSSQIQSALLGRHPQYIKAGNYKWLKALLAKLTKENEKRIELDKLSIGFDTAIKSLQTAFK